MVLMTNINERQVASVMRETLTLGEDPGQRRFRCPIVRSCRSR